MNRLSGFDDERSREAHPTSSSLYDIYTEKKNEFTRAWHHLLTIDHELRAGSCIADTAAKAFVRLLVAERRLNDGIGSVPKVNDLLEKCGVPQGMRPLFYERVQRASLDILASESKQETQAAAPNTGDFAEKVRKAFKSEN